MTRNLHISKSYSAHAFPGAVPGQDGPELEELLARYALAVRSGLMNCPVAESLDILRNTAGTGGASSRVESRQNFGRSLRSAA